MIKRFNKKGFTLVEIIVVLVILAAIAVPSVLGYVEQAKESEQLYKVRDALIASQTTLIRTYGTDGEFGNDNGSKNGNKIGTFKGGSFKAATKAKCPIVPVALINSIVPFDRNTIRPVTVQVHFLKPLEYEDYKEMKTTEIAALVEKQIQETIDANVGE